MRARWQNLGVSRQRRNTGGETAFFFFGALYFLSTDPTFRGRLLLALVSGVAWWMNQMVVFLLLPMLFVLIASTDSYRSCYEQRFFVKRYFLSRDLFPLPTWPRVGLLTIHHLLLANFLVGVMISFLGRVNGVYEGLRFNLGNGFSMMKTSVLIFVAIAFLLEFIYHSNFRTKAKEVWHCWKWFGAAFLLGYAPVLLGKIFHWYPPSYGVKFKFIPAKYLWEYYHYLGQEFFPQLWSIQNGWGVGWLGVLSVLMIIAIRGHWQPIKNFVLLRPGTYSWQGVLYGAGWYNGLYLLLADRALVEKSTRYGLLLMPVLFLFVAQKPVGKLKFLPVATLGMVIFFFQTRTTVERLVHAPLDFSPATKIVEMGAKICYARYWEAYLYEYLLDQRVEFIIFDSQDRTPERSKMLAAAPEAKCWLDHGEVHW